ncbi:Anti-sigma regulatory factor (Ser/Thr protein kinase) [Eubacterium ruminantium]|nr:Anti-sigma regulatory factor (Ser/Thr protein kinase) [Eubacterium ruminantium]
MSDKDLMQKENLSITEFTIGEESSEIDYKISDDGNCITIDAVDEAMDIVQDFIRDKLVAFGCDKKPMMQIRLAVEEIFVNIISYAYRPDIGKAEVFCEVQEEPMCVIIQFMDSGKPFDPLRYDKVDTSGAMFEEREGGFGIHLVKNTMDAVDYEYRDGMNILKIRKNLR